MKKLKTPLSSTEQKEFLREYNALEEQRTYYPKTIGLKEIDEATFDWFTEREFKIEGETTPVFYLNAEKWAEFKTRWEFTTSGENVQRPYVTIRRVDFRPPEETPRGGNIPGTKIPGRTFTTYKTPHFSKAGTTYKYFKVPQPVFIEMDYEVRVLTAYMEDNNFINEVLLRHFASLQSYLNLDGHYMPMKISSVGNESIVDLDQEKDQHTLFAITVEAYIMSEKDFEEVEGIAKTILKLAEE